MYRKEFSSLEVISPDIAILQCILHSCQVITVLNIAHPASRPETAPLGAQYSEGTSEQKVGATQYGLPSHLSWEAERSASNRVYERIAKHTAAVS